MPKGLLFMAFGRAGCQIPPPAWHDHVPRRAAMPRSDAMTGQMRP